MADIEVDNTMRNLLQKYEKENNVESDLTSLEPQDDINEQDPSICEDRFRVDRKKLEQMLQAEEGHGETGENFFQRIMLDTNTQITWPSKLKIGAKSKKDPHIKVSGKPEDVAIAKDRIMSILDTKSNRVTLKMDVSYMEHSHVIGKGGNNIKSVMRNTGCHIHFPDSNRGSQAEKSNQVSIAGQPTGVEMARAKIRELLPLVLSFEVPVTNSLHPIPDINSPTIQHIVQRHNIAVNFKRVRGYTTTITVRGAIDNIIGIKEATVRFMEHLTGNSGVVLPVSTQIEIAPQHHLFMIGRGGVNIKQIMQGTGATIHFPDPSSSQRKSTVFVSGPIDSVIIARHLLMGCLPLVLMFDMKEDIEVDSAKLSQLMETLDVFISIKPKPKQPSKSVIVKSIERNAGNMYKTRMILLGQQCEQCSSTVHAPPLNANGSISAPSIGLNNLSILSQNMLSVNSNFMSVNGMSGSSAQLPTSSGQIGIVQPTTINTSGVRRSVTPVTPVIVPHQINTVLINPVSLGMTSTTTASHHTPSPPPGLTKPDPVMVSNQLAQLEMREGLRLDELDIKQQANNMMMMKNHPQNNAYIRVPTSNDIGGCHSNTSQSASPTQSPRSSPTVHIPALSSSNTLNSLHHHGNSMHNNNNNIELSMNGNTHARRNSHSLVDLLMQNSISPSNSGNFSMLGGENALSSSQTQQSLSGSMNNGSMRTEKYSSESGGESDGSDKRAPGCERKERERQIQKAGEMECLSPFLLNYEQKKVLATRAMKKKPVVSEVRTPTATWSGLGFSKSMPESAIREFQKTNGMALFKSGKKLPTTYESRREEDGECHLNDSGSSSGSGSNCSSSMWPPDRSCSPRLNDTGYPSYRKHNFSQSNYFDATSLPRPTKGLWPSSANSSMQLANPEMAELFSKLGLAKYIDIFHQQEIDLATFMTLTDGDLKELGISTFGARRKMLLAISEIKDNLEKVTGNNHSSFLNTRTGKW
ncbi:protein bicaudal C homolog 1-like isoform X2 [Antedon mediterranea]|uniref:protein bicaudal C homolog 1-like isoform X2 n=1 Tax=Antedon mediterranea TaxID=105859 RepID=UPI003AF5F4B4